MDFFESLLLCWGIKFLSIRNELVPVIHNDGSPMLLSGADPRLVLRLFEHHSEFLDIILPAKWRTADVLMVFLPAF